MKAHPLALFALALALLPHAGHADTVYWDSTPSTPDGGSDGGAGTWDTSTANWDNGATYQTWNNGNNDTAVFGGTAGTVTLGTDITVGGIDFATNNYIIDGGGFSLTTGTTTTINNGGTATINAIIGGSADITKTGNGTLNLNALNTFTGNFAIDGGTVRVGGNNGTATFGASNYAGNISIASGAQLWMTNNQSQTFSGIISGDGDLNKGGSGTLTLSGNNTYTGKTIIAGSGAGGPGLSISSFNSVVGGTASSSLGAPTTVTNGTIQFGSSGNFRNCTLVYTGTGETTDRVMNVQFNSSAKHTIDQSGTGLLKFTSNFNITASSGNTSGGLYLRGSGNGEIAQIGTLPGFLEKRDAGTWSVGGTNAANAVNVDGGTLVNNGTMNVTTTFTVNNGATLSAGYITTNSMSLGATSSMIMELGGIALGTEYDNVTIAALGAMSYGGDLVVDNTGAHDMDSASQVYDLFSLNGVTPTNDFASVTVNGVSLSNSGGVWTGVNGDASYSFDISSGDLSITVIPEPSSFALLALGSLALWRRRR